MSRLVKYNIFKRMSTQEVNQSGNEFEFAALAEARNYRREILSVFQPFVQGDVLEVGCGIGQFAQDVHRAVPGARVTGLEPDPAFHEAFRRENPDLTLLSGTAQQLTTVWDGIICVNVLEHIKDDLGELQTYFRLLRPGGHLCLFVPARQEIYAPLDAKFGHFRRYARPRLQGQLETAGFKIVHLEYFNPIGYLAWFFACKLGRRQKFSFRSMRLFDRWVLPVSLGLGRLTNNPIGQSLIAVAAKPPL